MGPNNPNSSANKAWNDAVNWKPQPAKAQPKPQPTGLTGAEGKAMNGSLINAVIDSISNGSLGGTSGSSGVGGGGGYASAQAQAQARADAARKAEVDAILSSMGTLDSVLANRNQTTNDTYNQAVRSYDDTFALDRQARDKSQIQNEQANTDARQAAMVQAAAGGRGLRSVLASMGALGGTGLDLANQAVSREANIDIGNADKNFQTNAGNITDSWARAEDEDRRRRAEATTIRDNSLTNNAADVAASRQSMYNQLAGMYDRGSAEANSYLAKASALNPQIAAGSRQAVAPYAKSQQLFAPGKLQEYLGGVRDLSVGASAAPSGQTSSPVNSPLFGQLEDKRRQIGVA